MATGSPPRGTVLEAYRYSGLGCLFAAGVLLFTAGGWLLDRLFGTLPVFMVIGAMIGAALSTVSVYRRLQAGEGRDKTEDS